MRALHGFASLRTRPIEPLVPTVWRRRCTVCGAVLRSSNPSGTCATPRCSGVGIEPLLGWEEAIIEADGRHGAEMVARLRDMAVDSEARKVRDKEILRLAEEGRHTRGELADLYGISRPTVNAIVWEARKAKKAVRGSSGTQQTSHEERP